MMNSFNYFCLRAFGLGPRDIGWTVNAHASYGHGEPYTEVMITMAVFSLSDDIFNIVSIWTCDEFE